MESCGGKRKIGRDKREEGITQGKIGGGESGEEEEKREQKRGRDEREEGRA